MTIVMTAKHQLTIPKEIADILGLEKGSIFDVEVRRNRIELVPLEVTEKTFTPEQYRKLDLLCEREKGQEKEVTRTFIDGLKQGKV
ncbi:MAG: AbrB/MazE/SpoVT family DNA-binding domain-containing protein [Candidatus Omnitrophica bacterium]|nr:AbrB/MazE/SpoVT family DNA-binding domain-containing protein [Candidatus Omnitrophota bacterium]